MLTFSNICTKTYTSWKLLYPPVGLPWTSITDSNPKITFLTCEHKHIYNRCRIETRTLLNKISRFWERKPGNPDWTQLDVTRTILTIVNCFAPFISMSSVRKKLIKKKLLLLPLLSPVLMRMVVSVCRRHCRARFFFFHVLKARRPYVVDRTLKPNH